MDQVRPMPWPVHQPELEKQQPCEDPEISQGSYTISVVDEVPKQHLQARQAAASPNHDRAPVKTGNGSNRSTCERCNGFVKVFLQVEKIFKSNQLHGLNYSSIAYNSKTPFGVLALLGKLHKSTKT